MSDKDLHRHPKPTASEHVWWYETPEGVDVVMEPHPSGRTQTVLIPWSQVRGALKRKDRKPK